MSNVIEVSIGDAKRLIRKTIRHNRQLLKDNKKAISMPIYLHSAPGIGKSAVVDQIAREEQIGFVDVRLGTMEQSDVCGIPYVHEGEMKVSIPDWFPTEEKVNAGQIPAEGIVFFDELSNAPIGVQHAAYRIILDRACQNGVKMPEGWQIIAAGNRKEDKTGAKGVAPAMANRFAMHLSIKPDIDDFRAYAVERGLHTSIIGFLSFKQDRLYDSKAALTELAFATPRSWEQVSNLLDVGFDDEELQVAIAGCVGAGVAHEYQTFCQFYEKLPNFTDVMDGKVEYTVPKDDLGLLFAVTSSVITCLAGNADNKDRVRNLDKVMKQLGDEYLVLIYKSLKNLNNEKLISQVLVNTMDTYRRVAKYTKLENQMS